MDQYINKIIQGDCLEVMKNMPDKCIDLVVTDPPYGMGYKRHISNPRHKAIENDNNLEWLSDAMSEIDRLLKPEGNIYMFCSWHNVEVFKNEINKYFAVRNMLIWNKGGGGMGDLETTYGSVYEICLFANRTPSKLNGRRDNDVIVIPRSGNSHHPTEKPVRLFEYLINKSSEVSDIVFDPFIGSGTTARAALNLNRNYIGIEIDPEYCKIAEQRLRQQILSF